MNVESSARVVCENCRVVRRQGAVRVICRTPHRTPEMTGGTTNG